MESGARATDSPPHRIGLVLLQSRVERLSTERRDSSIGRVLAVAFGIDGGNDRMIWVRPDHFNLDNDGPGASGVATRSHA